MNCRKILSVDFVALFALSIFGCAQIPAYYAVFSGHSPAHESFQEALRVDESIIAAFQAAPFKWLSISLVLLLLLFYLLTDILRHLDALRPGTGYILKTVLVCSIILVIVVLPTLGAIYGRILYGPEGGIGTTDTVIETEGSLRALLAGRQPYGITYPEMMNIRRDVNRIWGYDVDVGASHCPYPPLAIVSSAPVYFVAQAALGTFDLRMTHLLFLAGIIVVCLVQKMSREGRLVLVILVVLNPFFIGAIVRGYNDCQALFWILLFTWALARRKHMLASVFLALAILSKQLAVILVPFYLLYVCAEPAPELSLKSAAGMALRALRPLAPIIAIVLLGLLPFIIWDAEALYDNLVRVQNSYYPLKGKDSFGIGSLLLYSGVVDLPSSPFPFWIPRLILGLPLLMVICVRQIRHNSASVLVESAFVMMFFVFAVATRAFHVNHLGFLAQMAALAIVLRESEAAAPVSFSRTSEEATASQGVIADGNKK
jgi:hypothetical protein